MDKFVDRFKNPALWITIIISFAWIVNRLNEAPKNANRIDVLERRLEKKIDIQTKLKKEMYELKLENQEEHHELEIKIVKSHK